MSLAAALPPAVRHASARALALVPFVPWYGWAAAAAAALAALLVGARAASGAEAAPTQPSGAAPLLKRGSSGAWVSFLQGKLGLAQSGTFDDATDAAVKAFQSAHGLTTDGIVGPMTWGALGVSSSSSTPHPSGGGSGPSSPPSSSSPAPPAPPPAPTTGNPFGLAPTVPEREGQMLALIADGSYEHAWWPLEYDTPDGHHVKMLVSRRAVALHDGTNRLTISTTFNTAQKIADLIGGAMLTSRISDEIWKHAGTKIPVLNKPWNTDKPVTGGKTDKMYVQSDDIAKHVAQAGDTGLVANEGKDWILTRRYWGQPTQGQHPEPAGTDTPAGTSGSRHNAANFGWYPGQSQYTSDGGIPVSQPNGLAHDRGNAGGFVDYSQLSRFVKKDSLEIDGTSWDYGAALADPSVSHLIQDEGGTIPGDRHPDLA